MVYQTGPSIFTKRTLLADGFSNFFVRSLIFHNSRHFQRDRNCFNHPDLFTVNPRSRTPGWWIGDMPKTIQNSDTLLLKQQSPLMISPFRWNLAASVSRGSQASSEWMRTLPSLPSIGASGSGKSLGRQRAHIRQQILVHSLWDYMHSV